ncbi:hypothetical protein PO909_025788 [Leuciscus waleckii]
MTPSVNSMETSGGETTEWQNKAPTVWPAAQDVGTEFALVMLVQRDLHTHQIYRSWQKSQLIRGDLTSSLSQ